MLSNAELQKLVSDVIDAARDTGAMVIDAVVSFDRDAVPVASASGSDFPALIKHVRPKIASVFAAKFGARDEVVEAVGGEGDAVLSHLSTKKLISAWRDRNGEISRIAMALMCDGVLHTAWEDADWLDDFEQAAEAAAEEIDRVKEEAERRQEDEERKKNASYVKS